METERLTSTHLPGYAREPLERIQQHGIIGLAEAADQTEIILLPSRTVPVEDLDPSRWTKTTPMGNVRKVISVDEVDGTGRDPRLVVKSAERVFTTDEEKLDRGNIWWDGPRSTDRPIRVSGAPVEERTLWEAAILTELWSRDIPTETPQAILRAPDGRVDLVVERIPETYGQPREVRAENLLEEVQETTDLVPVDATSYNAVTDPEGVDHLIDVNRWRWPGYTDGLDFKIAAAVRATLQGRKNHS
jgi:hypothetical protein